MLFHTLEFAVFFIIVYSLYLVLNHKWQNLMLLAASCFFYGYWDWRFLSLIFISTILDYFCANKIHYSKDEKTRKLFLYISIWGNLSILGFFKYSNFFIENFEALMRTFGLNIPTMYLNIILPLGISFYTFQTLSYVIDVYRKQLAPAKNYFDFVLFVMFFPQLVAGPIERASHLLPQVLLPRKVTLKKVSEGAHLIFWGLFLKMFIADNLALIVNPIFAQAPPYNGFTVLIGTYSFVFQIFCDFAGYSSIAQGLGLMMGFEIMTNFKLPFFVTNVQEFWNNWHISLSSWIRDYLYVPLFNFFKSMKGTARIYLSLILSMTIMGLWHGAAWHFALFGFYYGALLVIYILLRPKLSNIGNFKNPHVNAIWKLARIIFMFQITAIGLMIFRSQNLAQIWQILQALLFDFKIEPSATILFIKFVGIILPLLLVQAGQYLSADLMFLYKRRRIIKIFSYALMAYLILGWGVFKRIDFIYFQF